MGFIILDIANEGGEESRRTFTFGENMLICFESLHLSSMYIYKVIIGAWP